MFRKKKDELDVLNEELKKMLEEAKERADKIRKEEEKMTMEDKKARAEAKLASVRATQNLEILMGLEHPKEAKYFDIYREFFENNNELIKEAIEKFEKLMAENDEK